MPIQWPKGKRPCFVGVGYSPCRRRDVSSNFVARNLSDIGHEAAMNAIADAGLKVKDIDGISVYPSFPSAAFPQENGVTTVDANHMMQILDLENVRWFSESSGPMAVTSIIEAANALASGSCNYVIAWRALPHPEGGGYHDVRISQAGRGQQFILPYGIEAGMGRQAINYQRYMEKYGAKREEMATIIINARRNAQLNVNSVWKGSKPLTVEDYMNARMIVYPMCVFDCDMPIDGAACVVMTTEDRAKSTPHPGGYIAGYALSPHNKMKGGLHDSLEDLYEMNMLQGKNLYDSSGLTPKDVDVIHVYDGYSPMVWNWLEVLGFCKVGEAHEWTQGGRIALGGEKPMNPAGGNLGEGRLHGMGHIAETARQMMGTAGLTQVKGAEVAVCQVGPFPSGASFICTRD